MLKIKRLLLESPPASLHIIGAIYLLPSLLLYFVSEDLKFALLLEGYTFFESLRNIWLPSTEFLNEGGLFRPVVSTLNLIDYYLWGTNAFGYHLTNALIHLINIQLVYQFSLRIFKKVDIPFLCSILFLFHPILASSVYWISGRTDMVACSFYLLSLIMTSKYLEDQDIKYFILSQVLFFVALLSKEISITLPLAQLWMVWRCKHKLKQNISTRLLLIRYTAYGSLVLVLFLSYRLFIFGQSPFTIDSIYNIGGFYHFFINAVKIASFLVVPFGHQNFEMLVYDYKLYLIVVLIPIVIRGIMIVYQHRKELHNDIIFFSLFLISVLPIFKLAMRWYMYIPSVFFSIFLAHIIYSMWGKGDIARALVLIYLSLNIYGGLSSYRIWLDNSRVNRVLVSNLVDKIEKDTKTDTFVILNFPAKINRTATFVAGFEELVSLEISDKNKTVLRPVNIVHQSSMFPTDINQQGDNIVINVCEASSYCLIGTNRQRFGLEKLAAGDSIKTSVADINIEKVNKIGQAVRVTLSMHPQFEKTSTRYFYFNENKSDYDEYTF